MPLIPPVVHGSPWIRYQFMLSVLSFLPNAELNLKHVVNDILKTFEKTIFIGHFFLRFILVLDFHVGQSDSTGLVSSFKIASCSL
jgi:hypothetical protein